MIQIYLFCLSGNSTAFATSSSIESRESLGTNGRSSLGFFPEKKSTRLVLLNKRKRVRLFRRLDNPYQVTAAPIPLSANKCCDHQPTQVKTPIQLAGTGASYSSAKGKNLPVQFDNKKSFLLSQESGPESSQEQYRRRIDLMRPRIGENALGIEVFGRGAFGSIFYDHMTGQNSALGLAFSYVKAKAKVGGVDAQVSVTMLPLYSNLYLGTQTHRLLLTGGANLTYAKATMGADFQLPETEISENFNLNLDAEGSVFFIMPSVGTGYEYRTEGGVLARATAYAFYLHKFLPWFGLSFGTNF